MLGAQRIEEALWEEGGCHRCGGMVEVHRNGERKCLNCGMADYSRLKFKNELITSGGDSLKPSGRTPRAANTKDWSLAIRFGKTAKPELCLWSCHLRRCRDNEDVRHGCHMASASGSVYCHPHTSDFVKAFGRRPFLWRDMVIGSQLVALSILYQIRIEGRRVTWSGRYADITGLDCSGWFPVTRESIHGIKAKFEEDTGARLVKLDIALEAVDKLR